MPKAMLPIPFPTCRRSQPPLIFPCLSPNCHPLWSYMLLHLLCCSTCFCWFCCSSSSSFHHSPHCPPPPLPFISPPFPPTVLHRHFPSSLHHFPPLSFTTTSLHLSIIPPTVLHHHFPSSLHHFPHSLPTQYCQIFLHNLGFGEFDLEEWRVGIEIGGVT